MRPSRALRFDMVRTMLRRRERKRREELLRHNRRFVGALPHHDFKVRWVGEFASMDGNVAFVEVTVYMSMSREVLAEEYEPLRDALGDGVRAVASRWTMADLREDLTGFGCDVLDDAVARFEGTVSTLTVSAVKSVGVKWK